MQSEKTRVNVRGFKFPLTVDPIAKSLEVVEDEDLIASQISSVVYTIPGERVLNQDYGTPLMLFETIQDVVLVSSLIEKTLYDYIPNGDFEVTGTINGDGRADIRVEWTYLGEQQDVLKYTL